MSSNALRVVCAGSKTYFLLDRPKLTNFLTIFVSYTDFLSIRTPCHTCDCRLVSIVYHFFIPWSLENIQAQYKFFPCVIEAFLNQKILLQTLYSIQTIMTPCSSLVVSFWNTSFQIATRNWPLCPSKLRFMDKFPPPPK